MKKRSKNLTKRFLTDDRNIDVLPETEEEMKEAEHEFAMLLTESWEVICRKPAVHAKAVRTAKKLRELKTVLAATRQNIQAVH